MFLKFIILNTFDEPHNESAIWTNFQNVQTQSSVLRKPQNFKITKKLRIREYENIRRCNSVITHLFQLQL